MKTNNEHHQIMAETLTTIEEHCNVKFFVAGSLIMLYNYTLWRPALSKEEVRQALNENVPTVSMTPELVYVPLLWSFHY